MGAKVVDNQNRQYIRLECSQLPFNDNGPSPKCVNIIIEGVLKGEDAYEYPILLAEEIGIILHRKDLALINCLKRRDAGDDRPPLLLVGYMHT